MDIFINKWDTYWYLTILRELKYITNNQWKKIRIFECICKCWKIKSIRLGNLRSWHTNSCWCLKKFNRQTHMLTKTRIYILWSWMKNRCKNKTNINYWLKWIQVKWKTFEEFYNDMWEGYDKHCKEFWEQQTTIDRIDSNWDYCRENCRWATYKEQWRNKRNNRIYKWKCISQWCEELWLSRNTFTSRLRYGWTIEKALFT